MSKSTKKQRQARARDRLAARLAADAALSDDRRLLFEDVIADIDAAKADLLANLDVLAADPDHGKIAGNAARSLRQTRTNLSAAIEQAEQAAEAAKAPDPAD